MQRKSQIHWAELKNQPTNRDFVETFLCPWLGHDGDALISIINLTNVPSYAVQKEKF